jgi:hypothetical protein
MKKKICLSCYWAYPENYSHIAMRPIRRVDLLWQGGDVAKFDKLKADAKAAGKQVPEYVKSLVSEALTNRAKN